MTRDQQQANSSDPRKLEPAPPYDEWVDSYMQYLDGGFKPICGVCDAPIEFGEREREHAVYGTCHAECIGE